MRKRTPTATSTWFGLSLAAGLFGGTLTYAGWNTNAWPSPGRLRTGTLVTNVWAIPYNAIVTNTVGTNLVVRTNLWLNTITPAQVLTNQILTNLTLRARDLRALDAVMALTERWLVTTNVSPTGFQHDDPKDFGSTPQWYRFEKQNLDRLKIWLTDSAGTDSYWSPAAYFRATTNELGTWSWVSPNSDSLSNLCSYVGAPWNWCLYTPWRALDGGGPCRDRIVTNTWTISTTLTTSVNRAVSDSWGGGHVLSGTNGQVFTAIVTNADILAGFTSCDYGWMWLTNIVRELRITSASYPSAETIVYQWTATSNTWANAKTACEAASPSVTTNAGWSWGDSMARFTWGRKMAVSNYIAYAYAGTVRLTSTVISAPYDYDARFWARADPVGTWNAQGDPVTNSEWMVIGATNACAGVTVAMPSPYGNVTFPPVWCDEPTNSAGFSSGYRVGNNVGSAGRFAVVEWLFNYR